MNKQEADRGAATADQQKETPADRMLAKKIRHAIVSDSSLSTYAHNVKVIVRNGTVTLKGPVRSDDEKNAVAAKAAEIAGADKVANELTVKS
jgi:hyperosmotically inducible protein